MWRTPADRSRRESGRPARMASRRNEPGPEAGVDGVVRRKAGTGSFERTDRQKRQVAGHNERMVGQGLARRARKVSARPRAEPASARAGPRSRRPSLPRGCALRRPSRAGEPAHPVRPGSTRSRRARAAVGSNRHGSRTSPPTGSRQAIVGAVEMRCRRPAAVPLSGGAARRGNQAEFVAVGRGGRRRQCQRVGHIAGGEAGRKP